MHHGLSVECEPSEFAEIGGHHRPTDVLGLAVVDPPPIGKPPLGSGLLESMERDHDLGDLIIALLGLLGKVDRTVGAHQHRLHHRGDDPPILGEHDPDRQVFRVEADESAEMTSHEGEGTPKFFGEFEHRESVSIARRLNPMSFLCVPIFVDSSEDVPLALERAAGAVAAGARLVEWRLDAIAEEPEPLPGIERLLAESPAPCIVTIRAEDEGGTWAGTEQDRIAILEAIGTGDHPPAYIDIELKAWQSSANLRQKVRLVIDHESQVRDISTRLILSSHEFGGRPADLLTRYTGMVEDEACAIGKLVYMARSLRDCLEMFDLLASRPKPLIAIAMGEFGTMSRILAPKFGGFLTFAAFDPAGGTAPGQPTIEELRSTYRFDQIGSRTAVYGVVGHPVGHSLGPRLHNAGFEAADIDAVYLPLPVAPGWESFKATIGEFIDHPRLDFGGCSVTLPHKENLLRFARELGATIDPMAERAGAANTLVVERDDEGRVQALRCLNTDVAAAVASLAGGLELAGGAEADFTGRRVAIFGAGGVARAIVAGLEDRGAEVHVFNRSAERATTLVEDFGPRVKIGGGADELACGCFHAFVNATPIGMAGGPAPDESPLPDEVPLDDTVVVMDTVYTPRMTPMLRLAEDRGARIVDGMTMFVAQAEAQFEAWTSAPPNPKLFESVVGV